MPAAPSSMPRTMRALRDAAARCGLPDTLRLMPCGEYLAGDCRSKWVPRGKLRRTLGLPGKDVTRRLVGRLAVSSGARTAVVLDTRRLLYTRALLAAGFEGRVVIVEMDAGELRRIERAVRRLQCSAPNSAFARVETAGGCVFEYLAANRERLRRERLALFLDTFGRTSAENLRAALACDPEVASFTFGIGRKPTNLFEDKRREFERMQMLDERARLSGYQLRLALGYRGEPQAGSKKAGRAVMFSVLGRTEPGVQALAAGAGVDSTRVAFAGLGIALR